MGVEVGGGHGNIAFRDGIVIKVPPKQSDLLSAEVGGVRGGGCVGGGRVCEWCGRGRGCERSEGCERGVWEVYV